MQSELIQLTFDKIVQSRTYTMIVLSAPEKSFAIYTDPSIGKMLQLFLSEVETPRPLTHEFFDQIFEGLNVKIKQVVINNVEDTVYFARLFLEQDINDRRHIIEIDGRPSDCLTMALLNNAPVYCTRDVLERTIAVEEVQEDDD